MSAKKAAGAAIALESLRLPLVGVDSHAHLDLRHFAEDCDAVLDRARAAGVARIGNVFLNVAAWEQGRSFFVGQPQVFFLLGTHPTEAMNYSPAEREAMRAAFATDSRLRAVGEIGLDFYWKDCPPEIQIPVFIDQLHLARDLGCPVVIHCRDAYDAVMNILHEQGGRGYPLLWHCFGGTAEEARRIVDAGWHISISGTVTFPANKELRAALSVIPPDRLLLETDCPYLAPMPCRGKRNEPAYTAFTAICIAESLGCDPMNLWQTCGDNARRFFGI